jgi:GNAT superfamily N-acetyltransferase
MSAAPAAEPVITVAVDVTFLRMDAALEAALARPLPRGAQVVRVQPRCAVPFYRFLYNTVGQDYLWWLRRAAPDAEILAILSHPGVSVHVLYLGGQPAGFYELDRRGPHGINLSYFGLMPFAVGKHLGTPFLRHAIDTVWAEAPRALTVNTCTADHPRALPGYLAAGFRTLRTVRELWPVPVRLGLRIPERLRLGAG